MIPGGPDEPQPPYENYMLNQPMVEKLHALRLRGMAEGFA